MKTAGVILAGGIGQRVGAGIPKQLIRVAGRPLLAYPIDTFAASPRLDEVIVVMASGHLEAAEELCAPHGIRVIEGGETRTASTLKAMDVLSDASDDTRVLFHDAARAFVTHPVIDRCLDALETHESVAVALPVTDTVVSVADGQVAAMPPRSSLARFQTPQGFHLGTLRRAYTRALADPTFIATDDCGVVHHYLPDVPITIVEGDESLLKITTPLDLILAEHLATPPPP
ncbi:2-C-methyl-D-erythritol 4-phosphate cytidylyltransferase [Actinocorallia sp. A-T 12471]|uniref:2-C-methyl-D-erythritol 4-phosphate cytidylyltransferase n=1 Tax=Actinocorallia sp. A-T 12471 TaxID=3089813 RepID=UPI0029D3F511|nr:2-C-methyl-D-erythritol 4-phosphate cytidylyltransferase [Actinocorallia sp. A-T 12471]MDX6745101.1 2-C-methyl-D-erythritol 4-phosphate cytidylyltransferase [Actinocorallia sp. A-T 12471]